MGRRFETIVRRGWNGKFASHVNHNTSPAPPKNMVIPASVVHTNPRKFWTERILWNRTRVAGEQLPVWDRLANLALMLSQPVEPAEEPATAFRKLFDSWKNFFMTQILMTKSILLPHLTTGNVDQILSQTKKDSDEKEE
mmetsp:Transcript_27025/g.42082  ORF Transcript_27025/g.42082 Transcript_27025/m.42082 type:complete len:139 (-) Transcript_27025:12-428(-)